MVAEQRRNTSSEEETGLPDWLKGIEIEPSPESEVEEDLAWTADIDFSDLPGWLVPETTTTVPEEPFFDEREEEGRGLLAGVRGPIPVEPITLLSHDVPPFPGNTSRASQNRAMASASPFPSKPEIHTPPQAPGQLSKLVRAFVVVLLFALLVVALFTVVFVLFT